MFILHTNTKGQLFKVFILGMCCFVLYELLAHLIPEAPKDGAIWLLYLVGGCCAALVGSVIAWVSGIIHLQIDYVAGTVAFQRWWSRTTVPLAALAGYQEIRYTGARGRSVPPGWRLATADGRHFDLAPSNLKALPLLEAELTRLGIPLGKRVVKW